ncbi:two-CW domain-containing protein [Thermodesulfobacteriota bacterium]
MSKKNCWEIMKCGREPGGEKASELGVCPVTQEEILHAINDGINGGRACWAVAGTMCFGYVQGTFARKIGDCLHCEFFELVKQEEGARWISTKDILIKLKK